MGYFIDIVIVAYLAYIVYRGYKRGNVSNWLRLGYNVLGVGLASIYASVLNKGFILFKLKQSISHALINSNLMVDISVTAGGSKFPNTNLPEELNTLFKDHFELLNNQQETIWAVSEKIIVNILGALACYLLIWAGVRLVFYIANTFVIKVNTSGYYENTITGVVPAIGNALICAMLLSGVLWPFIILFDKIGLAYIWQGSRILQFLANIFYASFVI